jgi:F-type H+-transporting ATPase subunit b
LNERTRKIEKGLKDAENAELRLTEMQAKEKEVLKNAKEEGQKIMSEAETRAQKNKEELLAEAKVQTEKILVEARRIIAEEKIKMINEVKGEIANLVVAATEKVIDEKMDSAKDRELIEKAIK